MNLIVVAFVGGALLTSWATLPRSVQATAWWSGFLGTIALSAVSVWQIAHYGL